MARVIIFPPEGGQQIVELRPFNTLGRHPNNTIQLLDKIVSKEHCIIEQRETRFLLRDLGSLNGTYINQSRVQGEQWLKANDEISLGTTRIRFEEAFGFQQPGRPSPAANAPPQSQQSPYAPPAQHGAPPAPQNVQPGQWPQGGAGAPSVTNPAYVPPGSNPHVAFASNPPLPPGVFAPGQLPNPAIHQAPGMWDRPTALPPQAPPQGYQPGRPASYQDLPAQSPPAPSRPPGVSETSGLGTRVDVRDQVRAIGTQIAAATKGFLPFDQVAADGQQLRVDYERLRLTWELSREIALERDLDKLLNKILLALFKFVNADRGAILLREEDGTLQPKAALRRDGSEAPIQVSSTILSHVTTEKKAVITHDAALDFAASKGKSMILNRIQSAIVVPLLYEQDVLGALWLDSESVAQFQPKDLEIVTAVGNQAAMFIQNTLLTKKIEQEIINRERFSRLLSPNIAEQVMSGKLEVKKGGVLLKECTVFNSDIRGFTRMSEGTPAEQMVDMLNEYFEEMVAAVFRYDGTLDKFMGDGIMAIWGAPVSGSDDAIRCVQSALEQMEILGRFNRRRLDRSVPPLAIGIGIHTGPLVAGYVGSSKALSYTVIGDTANTGARLCSHALPGQILISETTLAALGGRFEVEELHAAELKGKEKAMRVYNVKREKPTAAAKK